MTPEKSTLRRVDDKSVRRADGLDLSGAGELQSQSPYAMVAERISRDHSHYKSHVPMTMGQAKKMTKNLMAIMFPHFSETSCRFELAHEMEAVGRDLAAAITRAFSRDNDNRDYSSKAELLAHNFILGLADIAELCRGDAIALKNGDPAARSLDEVILSYPGFYAVAVYRLAHALVRLETPIIPRLMAEAAHQKTGIDIHPAASIGENFYIDHGTGVVIGETTIVGKNVKIYQGVTLGGLKVEKEAVCEKRHPTLEDNVTVYAGATILGGRTVVGHDSIIGGNVWLTRSVDPWSRVMFKSCDQSESISIQSRRPAAP